MDEDLKYISNTAFINTSVGRECNLILMCGKLTGPHEEKLLFYRFNISHAEIHTQNVKLDITFVWVEGSGLTKNVLLFKCDPVKE